MMINIKKILENWKEIGVISVAVILIILFSVFGKKDYVSKGCEIEKYASSQLTDEVDLIGTITPQYENLKDLSFIVNRDDQYASGEITVELYDADGNVIGSSTQLLTQMSLGYMNKFPMNCKVTPGAEYTYGISIKYYGDFPITIDLATSSACAPETGACKIGNKELTNAVPLMELTYRTKMNFHDMQPYLLCIFLFTIVLFLAVGDKKKMKLSEKISIYILFILAGVTILSMNDEGKKPLEKIGTELIHEQGGEDFRGYLTIDGSSGFSGLLASSNEYILDKGQYTLQISYQTDTGGNTLEVYNDKVQEKKFELNPVNTYATFPFTLDQDAQNIEIRVYYEGTGTLKLNQITLVPQTSFYSDNTFFIFLFLLINVLCLLLYIRNIKKPFEKEKLVDACVMILLAIFVTAPFYASSMAGADDQCYHLLRIEGLKDAILDGQVPAIILPNAMSGNGYLNSMYPYLFLYLPALLRICGVSLILSYKFLVFVMNAATVVAAYYSIRCVAKSRYAAILGSALYILLPYRYTNIYARGALGEMLAMTFIPLLLAGFYNLLFGDKNKWMLLVLGFSGLLESHVLSFVIMCIFAILCCIIFIRNLFHEGRIISLIKAAIWTVVLNLWFVIPFVWYYLKGSLGTDALGWSNYIEYAINPSFFSSTISMDSNRYLSFGIPVLLCFAFCILHLICERKDNDENENRENYFRLIFVLSCVMTTMITGYSAAPRLMEIIPLEKFFKLIQFPWRLFAPVSAMIIFISVIWMAESEILNRKNIRMPVFLVLIGLNLFSGLTSPDDNNNFAYYNYLDNYSTGHELKLRGIQPTDGTIRYPYEWRLNCVDETKILLELSLADYENTEIISYKKVGTDALLSYVAKKSDSSVIFPIMNYYGYHAYDENNYELPITLERGYAIGVSLNADSKEHQIRIAYEMPALFMVSVWISILGAVLLLINRVVWYSKSK